MSNRDITINVSWEELIHTVQILHGTAANRRLNNDDTQEGRDEFEQDFARKQLAMADLEESVLRKLMNAHVANGGDLEDFARL